MAMFVAFIVSNVCCTYSAETEYQCLERRLQFMLKAANCKYCFLVRFDGFHFAVRL